MTGPPPHPPAVGGRAPAPRRVRLRRVSPAEAMLAAAVGGFVAGLFVGCVLGALLSWLAGAVLNWQNQLAFQLGVTETLLPLGQQVELLQEMQDDWWLVVPLVGFALGLPGALAAGLAAGLLAQLFNRFLPIDLTVEDVEDRPR